MFKQHLDRRQLSRQHWLCLMQHWLKHLKPYAQVANNTSVSRLRSQPRSLFLVSLPPKLTCQAKAGTLLPWSTRPPWMATLFAAENQAAGNVLTPCCTFRPCGNYCTVGDTSHTEEDPIGPVSTTQIPHHAGHDENLTFRIKYGAALHDPFRRLRPGQVTLWMNHHLHQGLNR